MKKAVLFLSAILTMVLIVVGVIADPAIAGIGLANVGILAGLTPSERAELLSLVRENMNFEGDELYEGSNDDFVDFDGPNGSFLTESSTSLYRTFTMNIYNDQGTSLDVYLTPGLLWSPEAARLYSMWQQMEGVFTVEADDMGSGVPAADVKYMVDLKHKEDASLISRGFITDGSFPAIGKNIFDSKAFLTAEGTPYNIEMFYAFIMNNPTNLLQMKIQCTEVDQLSYPIEVFNESPFKQLESKIIKPDNVLDQNSQQQNVALFNTNGIVLGNQTQLKYRIGARIDASTARKVTVTFYCGAIMNSSNALLKKQTKAVRNFAGTIGNKAISGLGLKK